MGYRLGVDVGGTFTDLVLFDEERDEFRAERRMVAGIRSLPAGTYAFEDYLEGTGLVDEMIRIRATVTIGDGRIAVDFSGTSPQVRGPINCRLPSAQACVYYAIKAIVGFQGWATVWVINNIYDSLYTTRDFKALVPALATGHTVSDDDVPGDACIGAAMSD
ncbi:MAG: hydantoinase B/oxoprolinase family protein [Chloroflexi bacterium]|nr:hydantoinase B/oxoprolinase family protein [Chloroflexota bacterium]